MCPPTLVTSYEPCLGQVIQCTLGDGTTDSVLLLKLSLCGDFFSRAQLTRKDLGLEISANDLIPRRFHKRTVHSRKRPVNR